MKIFSKITTLFLLFLCVIYIVLVQYFHEWLFSVVPVMRGFATTWGVPAVVVILLIVSIIIIKGMSGDSGYHYYYDDEEYDEEDEEEVPWSPQTTLLLREHGRDSDGKHWVYVEANRVLDEDMVMGIETKWVNDHDPKKQAIDYSSEVIHRGRKRSLTFPVYEKEDETIIVTIIPSDDYSPVGLPKFSQKLGRTLTEKDRALRPYVVQQELGKLIITASKLPA